jgi:hypothetical protein
MNIYRESTVMGAPHNYGCPLAILKDPITSACFLETRKSIGTENKQSLL